MSFSGSEQVESPSVELMALTLVDHGEFGDDSVAIGDNLVEQAT